MRGWGVLLWTLAGCYHPIIASGAPCDTSDQCPSELACIDHTCGGGPADASLPQPDAETTIDARGTDALVIEHIAITDTSLMRDTEVWGANPNINYGTVDHTSIDDSESPLYWFDLTSIPTTKHVMAATLTVTVADSASTDGGTATINRLREGWFETEATWIARTSAAAWSVSGARVPASDATPVASFTPAALSTAYDIALPPSLVEAWIGDPSQNFGVIIVRGTSTMHVHLGSRESANPPKLAVDVY